MAIGCPLDRGRWVEADAGRLNHEGDPMSRVVNVLGVVLGLVLLSAGCASIRPAVTVKHFGSLDPERDQRVSAVAYQNVESEQPGAVGVEVVSGSLPPGLDLREGGTKLVVQKEAAGEYQIIGEVEASYTPALKGALLKNVYWTWTNYREGWRKGLCYPQAPLKALTLGIWTFVVPLAWPCIARAPSEETARQIDLVRALKFGAQAMGGNLVVVVSEGQTNIVHIQGNQNSATAHVQTIRNTSFRAFVVRRRAAPVPAGQSAGL
jgi:hypothetical protein